MQYIMNNDLLYSEKKWPEEKKCDEAYRNESNEMT